MQENQIPILKNTLEHFHDCLLVVEDFEKTIKKYPVHRIILSNFSSFFHIFFKRESFTFENPYLVYKMIIPFSHDAMDICLKIFYGDDHSLNANSVDKFIDALYAMNYFSLSDSFLERMISTIIITLDLNPNIFEEHAVYLANMIQEYDMFMEKKKINILHRLQSVCSFQIIDNQKFKCENLSFDNQLIITENADTFIRANFPEQQQCPIFRNMIFQTDVDRFSVRSPNLDNVFIGVTSRPIEENKNLDLDEQIKIREDRTKGKDIVYKAKGKIIVFNGLDDPFELPIINFNSSVLSNEELLFPPDCSFSSNRNYYGALVEISKFNFMTKFKIVLEFY